MFNQSDPEFDQPKKTVALPDDAASSTVESHILQGDKLWQAGKHSEAIADYRQALQLEPNSVTACQKLAEALKHQGKLEEAVIYFRQAVKLNQPRALEENELQQQQQIDKTVEMSTAKVSGSIVKLEPITVATGAIELANKFQSQAESATIIHNFKGFIEPSQWQRPKNQSGLMAVARSEATAKNYLQQALDDAQQQKWSEALISCDRALEIAPNWAKVHKVKGSILDKNGQIAGAIGCYSKALAIKPDYAQIYANLGRIYAQQHQWQKSIACYQKSIAIAPRFAGAYRNLAKVWYKLGKKQKAFEATYQALTIEPEKISPRLHYEIGNQLLKQNRVPEALDCYRYAIKLEPSLTKVCQKLAETLENQE